MDISDGLSSSLSQLQELNKVGFAIDQNSIPLSDVALPAKNDTSNLIEYALHSGGDYELLCTISEKKFPLVKKTMEDNRFSLFNIGTVTKEQDITLNHEGKKSILENKGYEHFTSHF